MNKIKQFFIGLWHVFYKVFYNTIINFAIKEIEKIDIDKIFKEIDSQEDQVKSLKITIITILKNKKL